MKQTTGGSNVDTYSDIPILENQLIIIYIICSTRRRNPVPPQRTSIVSSASRRALLPPTNGSACSHRDYHILSFHSSLRHVVHLILPSFSLLYFSRPLNLCPYVVLKTYASSPLPDPATVFPTGYSFTIIPSLSFYSACFGPKGAASQLFPSAIRVATIRTQLLIFNPL